MLNSQYYTNCIRTEAGYCRIQWKQSSTTSPDPFEILGTTPAGTVAAAGGSATTLCTAGFVSIPDLSMDGIGKIPVPYGVQAYQSTMCGKVFGIEGTDVAAALVCKLNIEVLLNSLHSPLISPSCQTAFRPGSLH